MNWSYLVTRYARDDHDLESFSLARQEISREVVSRFKVLLKAEIDAVDVYDPHALVDKVGNLVLRDDYRQPDPAPMVTARYDQVGGVHYKKHGIQPWDVWQEYGLNAFEGAILKYLLRWRDKNGVEDLKKARHTLDKLIEIEESRSE